MLPIVMDEEVVDGLFKDMYANEGYQLTVDLAQQKVIKPNGEIISFDVEQFRKHCLLNGLDDIGLTLQDADAISAYEYKRRQQSPWLFDVITK
jgi:3-isopropylmalate/(R)-2-methylmalate dehydratase small subunit